MPLHGLELVKSEEQDKQVGTQLFCCVRNEEKRLPYFLKYYRNIGVSSFKFIDNESSDSTLRLLNDQSDCTTYFTQDSYSESNYGMSWINELLNLHALDRWALVVDSDELIVYPEIEKKNIDTFTMELDQLCSDTFFAVLIDMYSAQGVENAICEPGVPFTDICPYFDAEGYSPGYRGLPAFGGVRNRMFWLGRNYEKNPPFLQKYPLVKWRDDRHFISSTHVLNDQKTANVTGALLHFKLFSDFADRCREEVERKEHWKNAIEYKIYLRGLEDMLETSMLCEHSCRYKDSNLLIDLGLMLHD